MIRYSMVLLPIVLASCSTIQTALDLADRAERFEELEDRFRGTPETDAANIPASGTATYGGVAAILIDEGADDEVIIAGDARVTVNFANDQVRGTFDDFAQYDGGISFTNYGGELTMADGVIGGTNPGDITGTVRGTLSGGGDTIVVDAEMDTAFIGNPIMGILGESIDSQTTITVDGAGVDGRVGFAVETD